MATKYDLPQTSEYINNYLRYQELYLKANKTQAEIDEMNSLFNTLSAYLITASDFNNKAEQATLDEHLADGVKHITSAERTSWNGKLDANIYTANDILSKIKTVDGSGSGLDADTLDGKHLNELLKIASGSYTGDGSMTGRTITVGFQPAFLILLRKDGTEYYSGGTIKFNNSFEFTVIRGPSGGGGALSEYTSLISFISTGFQILPNNLRLNDSSIQYYWFAMG